METLSHQLRSPHGQGPPLLTWFNLNPNMDKQLLIIYKVWDIITYPFPNFNGACRNTWWRSRGALIFSLICIWINSWVNNREAGDLRRHRAHHDVVVMIPVLTPSNYGISLVMQIPSDFLDMQNITLQKSQPCVRMIHCQLSKLLITQKRSVQLSPLSTYQGRDIMAAISQTKFSYAFSGMKTLEFQIKCYWNIFLCD